MKYLSIVLVLTSLITGTGCSQTPVSVKPDAASTEAPKPTTRNSINWMQIAGIALLVGISANSMPDNSDSN